MSDSMIEPTDLAIPAARTPIKTTKAATVLKLLARNRGATLAEVMTATNWQPHSTRAFLSGLRKKGTVLIKETRKDGDTSYRIEGR